MSEHAESLQEQLESWADGTLSDSEVASLRELLHADADARSEFVRWQMVNAALKLDASHSGSPEVSVVTAPTTQAGASAASISWRRLLAIAAGIVFCVIASRWAYLELHDASQSDVAPIAESRTNEVDERDTRPSIESRTIGSVEPTAQGIALVTRLVDARWNGKEQSLEVGQALTPGRVSLVSGYAQIEFFCGASVVIEGPAELDLVSTTSAKFLKGRMRAQVPPAARGFQIDVDGMKVVDLGTEFGVSVSTSGADVQVFDGQVELHPEGSEKQVVNAGQAFLHGDGSISKSETTPDRFVDLARLDTHAQDQNEHRYQRWQQYTERVKRDDRLIAYYIPMGTERWKRKLSDQAIGADGECDGAIVGAKRVAGRWPGTGALEFKHPGDRVRVNIGGEFRSLTFACWTKIDSLDRWYNSLFLTDNYQLGEPHWQILDTGELFFSVRPSKDQTGPPHHIVKSKPFWNPSLSGKWLHLVTTYDVDAKRTTHYLNGKQLHQESIPDKQLVEVTRIGMASIGNWSVPTKPDEHFAIRNLNGAIDELAIFAAALDADEIAEMYENGKP